MQKAIDHLEKHKVFVDSLGIEMIPATEAYIAIELSVDQQIQDTLNTLQQQLGGLVGDLQNEEKND